MEIVHHLPPIRLINERNRAMNQIPFSSIGAHKQILNDHTSNEIVSMKMEKFFFFSLETNLNSIYSISTNCLAHFCSYSCTIGCY